MWQVAILIVQIAIIVASLALIVPLRYIKSKYFEKRITTVDWLGTLGRSNKERLDKMLMLREQTALLAEEVKLLRERTGRMNPFWDEHYTTMMPVEPNEGSSQWKLVDGKSVVMHLDKENGSDDDDANKDKTE